MSERDSQKSPEGPKLSGANDARAAEKARLAAALRANLQRRKAQARARAGAQGVAARKTGEE